MKKIMIAIAVAALALASQAASFSWKSSTNAMGIDVASVSGNGDYTAGTSTMKVLGSTAWTAVLSIYSGSTLVGESAATAVKFSTTGSKFNVTGIDVAAAEAGTAYDYVIKISGSPTSLTGKTDAAWDYSAAVMTTTLSGTVTTEAMGLTTLTSGVPATWTVSGAVAAPEPTSGLLLLLGMAGLALKRKIA